MPMRPRTLLTALILPLAGLVAAAQAQAQAVQADAADEAVAVLTAARIHTENPAAPLATAIAWNEHGRLVAVGKAAELRKRYPKARHVDAGKATVVPGLIDAHAHLMGLGDALMLADLTGADSREEVVRRLQAFAQTVPADAW
ncbi:MAG: amidohydrolase family protein, partial [Xanthomonadaceae bacterium]|nr:amidohydrolase family protein [Xanthomonadaceae bacterium]